MDELVNLRYVPLSASMVPYYRIQTDRNAVIQTRPMTREEYEQLVTRAVPPERT